MARSALRLIPALSICLFAVVLWSPSPVLGEDVVEFLSGAKLRGQVTAIDKLAKTVTFETQIGSSKIKRTYPYAQIHAVLYRGTRYVLTETPEREASGDKATRRSQGEVIKLINQAGSTPPAWFASTPLEYPKTLDLRWPLKPGGKWNSQRNMGQYLWDVIYPNSKRWRSGVRLVHYLLTQHQGDPALLRRDRNTLGSMYFNLFQDYARAAYWWRRAGVTKDDNAGAFLGECYWRLGNQAMGLAMLDSRRLNAAGIKVYGAMGRVDDAVKYAERYVRAGGRSQQAYLLAADACRKADRTDQAVAYYRKVLAAADARNKDYDKRFDQRAKESIEAIQLQEMADVAKVRDGTFRASGSGYAGLIDVEVEVEAHRIMDVRVVKHHEKQFYSALTDTTKQIIKKQSVKGIDATSRATITSIAIINAAAKALAKGAGEPSRG